MEREKQRAMDAGEGSERACGVIFGSIDKGVGFAVQWLIVA